MMQGREKSDSVIVAGKSPNKTGEPGAEAMERRAGAEENASQQRTRRTQSRESLSQRGRFRIRVKSGHKVGSNGSGCGLSGPGRSLMSRAYWPKRRMWLRV